MSTTAVLTLPVSIITGVKNRTIAAAVAIAAAVTLPQLLHVLGAQTGLGASIAQAILPMHIPIILVGLLAGPTVGVIAGAASPLIAFALSGMPVIELLPFIVLELAAYGLVAGLLTRVRLNIWLKTIIVLVAGRLVRLGAIAFAIGVLGQPGPALSSVWDATVAGLPGIILMLIALPLIVTGLQKRGLADDPS